MHVQLRHHLRNIFRQILFGFRGHRGKDRIIHLAADRLFSSSNRPIRSFLDLLHDFIRLRPLRALGSRRILFPLLLDTALILYMLNTLIGDVIDYHSGRLLNLFFLILPIGTRTILHRTNDAGYGDLHSAKQSDHSRQGQQNDCDHAAAQPTKQHRNTAADKAAGGSTDAAHI